MLGNGCPILSSWIELHVLTVSEPGMDEEKFYKGRREECIRGMITDKVPRTPKRLGKLGRQTLGKGSRRRVGRPFWVESDPIHEGMMDSNKGRFVRDVIFFPNQVHRQQGDLFFVQVKREVSSLGVKIK